MNMRVPFLAVTCMILTPLYANRAAGQPATAETSDEGPALTVYSTADPAGFDPQQFIAQQRAGGNPQFAWQVPGFGVVKEIRRIALREGPNEVRFTDVAEFIDPTTVSFADLTDAAGTAVLEQNFQFDLVSQQKLLEKYVDKEVTVFLPSGDKVEPVSGVLLSASPTLVLRTAEGLRVISGATQQVRLGALPEGLITRPALVWKLRAGRAGEHTIRATYQTGGLTWRADYNLVLQAGDARADVGAWVTLMNLSGAGYRNGRLKLIAGDVQRIQPGRPWNVPAMAMKPRGADADEGGFQEKAFFEYHLYTLPRRTDVLQNSTQQITLFPTARDVQVEKLMVYYGLPEAAHWGYFGQPQTDRNFGVQGNPKIDVYLRFKNEKANQMGMPLPKGKVRVYKQDDADGTLEFIGEDLIDHTAKDEKVLVKLGQAFDVVGERKQTDFQIDTSRRTMTESYRIQIRNHKTQPQKVIIKENLYRWSTWEITEKSDPFEKIDARTIHFEVTVPADGEKTVTYTVRYTW